MPSPFPTSAPQQACSAVVYKVTIQGPACPSCAVTVTATLMWGIANAVGLAHTQISHSWRLPAWESDGVRIFRNQDLHQRLHQCVELGTMPQVILMSPTTHTGMPQFTTPLLHQWFLKLAAHHGTLESRYTLSKVQRPGFHL